MHIGLAFTAGMLATINPCGLPMLPAYLGYFLGVGDEDQTDGPGVWRAVLVALSVAAGFLAVFGTAGALLSWFEVSLYGTARWFTVIIGVALAVLGVAMLGGFELAVRLPKLNKGGGARTFGSMFLFGISYAVASLSCTLPVFLVQVTNTFGRSFAQGLALYGVYALGMTLVLVTLTVAVALAREGLVHRVRSALPYVNRVAGGLLVLTGLYVAWYGLYEIRGTAGADPAVDRVTGWSADLSNWVQDVGAVRIGVVLGLVVVLIVLVTLWRRAARDDRARRAAAANPDASTDVALDRPASPAGAALDATDASARPDPPRADAPQSGSAPPATTSAVAESSRPSSTSSTSSP